MTEIRLLTAEDHDAVEQMKQIWRECFDAEMLIWSCIFSVRYRPEENAGLLRGRTGSRMLTILPCTCRAPWNVSDARQYRAYLFAVGTLPRRRRAEESPQELLSEADRYLQRGVEVSMLRGGRAKPLFQF